MDADRESDDLDEPDDADDASSLAATDDAPAAAAASDLAGQRILLVGRLAGMSRRDAQQAIRAAGGLPVEALEGSVDLIVLGEEQGLPLDERGNLPELLDAETREAIDQGTVQVIGESRLWQRLGLVENHEHVHRLYTPAMLAELLHVPLAVVRRWHRRGLIRPARVVCKLPYFDFQEVASARALAQLLAAGVASQAIEKKLHALRRFLPEVDRPLAQLSVIVEGKQMLLRQGGGLLEPGGQLRFDFDAPQEHPAEASPSEDSAGPSPLSAASAPPTFAELVVGAEAREDAGDFAAAASLYRAAMEAGGPDAEICFRLAELLYRLGEPAAARERYQMAIELDEGFVEARSNLGCVLTELGDLEAAVAAFRAALDRYPDYPDVHYHLAHTLDELGSRLEALDHWRAFLVLAPDSPWADEARQRLQSSPPGQP